MRSWMLVTALSVASEAMALDAWTAAPPFSVPGKELLDLAAATAPGAAEVQVLLIEDRWRIDEEGRIEHTVRRVYQVRGEKQLRSWGEVSATWDPWYQARPEIDARVISVDGVEHRFDSATTSEAPVRRDALNVYADRRRVQAPLPRMAVGVVVEEQVITRDRDPYFIGGRALQVGLDSHSPSPRRIVVEAPVRAPFRWEVVGSDVKPRESRDKGIRRLSVEVDALPKTDWRDQSLPPGLDAGPSLRVGVGGDWAELASAYAAVVDARVGTAGIEALVAEVESAGADPIARVAAAAAIARDRIRYTGLELGVQAIEPWTPAETVARGFGDCKDKSTLLVALLRAVGVEAHVVLLRTGRGTPPGDGYPALEAFNHAIVRVEMPEVIWVDPTADDTPFGALPPEAQGQPALIARAGELGLLRLPVAPASASAYRFAVTFDVPSVGDATIGTEVEASGWIGDAWRAHFQRLSEDELRSWGKRQAEADGVAAKLSLIERTPTPSAFGLRWEAEDVRACTAQSVKLTCAFHPWRAVDYLPDLLWASAEALNEDESHADPLEGRVHPIFVTPHVAETTYHLRFDPIYTPVDLPSSRELRVGDARIAVDWTHSPGEVRARVNVDLGDGLFAVDEARAVRRFLVDEAALEGIDVELHNPVFGLFDQGKGDEALAMIAAARAADPERAFYGAMHSFLLALAAQGDLAGAEIRALLMAHPDDPFTLATAGYIASRDAIGREGRAPSDRAGAIAAYARAAELQPDRPFLLQQLGELYLRDHQGNYTDDRADLARAVEAFEAALALGETGVQGALMTARLRAGQYDRVAAGLDRTQDDVEAHRVAGVAMQLGADAAAAALRALPTRRRDAVALLAADVLFQHRQYSVAARVDELVPLSGPAASHRSSRRSIADEHRFEAILASTKGVERAFWEISGASMASPPDFDTLTAATQDPRIRWELHKQAGQVGGGFRGQYKDMSALAVRDAAMWATGAPVFEGSDRLGWTVTITVPGNAPSKMRFVEENGRYFVVSHPDVPLSAARGAQAQLERGQLAAARAWFADALDEVGRRRSIVWYTRAPVLDFAAGGVPEKAEDLRLAIAMTSVDDWPKEAIPVLEAALVRRDASEQPAVARALVEAYISSGAWADLLHLIEERRADVDTEPQFCGIEVEALERLGRLDESRAVFDVCKDGLNSYLRQRLNLRLAVGGGDRAAVLRAHEAVLAVGNPSPSDINRYAWALLWHEDRIQDALAHARTASQRAPENLAMRHTLACALALSGMRGEAIHELGVIRDKAPPGDRADRSIELVLGMLAEMNGFPEEARARYATVVDGPGLYGNAGLAAHRVARLDAQRAAP